MPLVPPKTSPEVQNLKSELGALYTAENEVHQKNERFARCLWGIHYNDLINWRLGAQNIKSGPNALDTVENESGSAEYEIWILCPRYRRKPVWKRKIWKLNPALPR
jgi:hypothetical protein